MVSYVLQTHTYEISVPKNKTLPAASVAAAPVVGSGEGTVQVGGAPKITGLDVRVL